MELSDFKKAQVIVEKLEKYEKLLSEIGDHQVCRIQFTMTDGYRTKSSTIKDDFLGKSVSLLLKEEIKSLKEQLSQIGKGKLHAKSKNNSENEPGF